MHRDDTFSIFSEYYQRKPLVDRFESDRALAVDVIIPIIHTNEMWRANLLSIYREIPVKRLLLGDGGCIDNSLDVAREFPRVEVLDHRHFTSLGFSLRHLIEATSTDWFVYLHSDVYLAPGWFDAMSANREKYDWFECNQRITVMADYLLDTTKVERSYSGSQMGRKVAFEKVTPLIDDDYLYRNEDIILAKLLVRAGGRYGKVGETHHFHQIMHKPSRWGRAVKRVAIDLELAHDEDIRANETYARGIIKYLDPAEVTADRESVRMAVERLIELNGSDIHDFVAWVRATNPRWLPLLEPLLPRPVVAPLAASPALSAPPPPPRQSWLDERLRTAWTTYRAYGVRSLVNRVAGFFFRRVNTMFGPRAKLEPSLRVKLAINGVLSHFGVILVKTSSLRTEREQSLKERDPAAAEDQSPRKRNEALD